MKDQKIKYGIIGCGKHTLNSHAIPCKDVSNLELKAICDISLEGLTKFEEVYGKPLDKFTDREKFFNSNIDAILIGTPDECHSKDLTDSIHAGKHTFVEKPLATGISELPQLEDTLSVALKKDLIISSCHLRRFDPPFMWLKENLPKLTEKFGNPISFGFDFSYHKPTKIWKHTRGLLLDHANHEIDLVNYLFGHSGFEAKKLVDKFDHYQVFGKRNDGINFEFQGTRRLDSREFLEWVKIRFEKGELLLDTHLGSARIHDHENNLVYEEKVPATDYDLRGKRTLVNFANAIQGKEPCYLTHEDLYVNTATSVILTERDNWKYEKEF